MNYQGYTIEGVDEYSADLPSNLQERIENDVPTRKLYLVFDGNILVGVFFSYDAAKGFIEDLVARNVSAAQVKAEYERYIKELEDETGFLLRKAFETILEIEIDRDEPDPGNTPRLR